METGHDRCGWLVVTNVGVTVDVLRGQRFPDVVGVDSLVECTCGYESEAVRVIVRDRSIRGINPELQEGVGMGKLGTCSVVAGQEQYAGER